MKKIATGRQISMVVNRALSVEIRAIPEVKLWLAVIASALVEADNPKKSSARTFLASDSFALICEVIGLDPDWVNELIRDHAGWMRDKETPRPLGADEQPRNGGVHSVNKTIPDKRYFLASRHAGNSNPAKSLVDGVGA